MRPSLLVSSLLLLSFLISQAQGIRLGKGFASFEHHKIHEGTLIRTSNGGVGDVILCKDGHYSGNCRKLMTTKTTSSTINTSKTVNSGGNRADPMSQGKSSSEQLGGKEENFSINPSPVTEHRQGSTEHYPDILDIAGMDYSPARRKTPIHN
ncbi:uncharacterized protein LOC132278711 [Cornus florida]|uniref:uncharacterized protein LOC132278711 n=1 Tax=Cornus florida TaxID=4283 RepID=UPI0028A0A4FE|nr:uncharacterized protein LOC132278711 [Cornus florida]